MRKAVLFVDMQNDFITGTLASPEDNLQIGGVNAVIGAIGFADYNISKNDLVYASQDTHYDDYLETQEGINLPIPHCMKGTEGAEIELHLLWAIERTEAEFKIMEKSAFGAVNIVSDLETQHVLNPLSEVVLMGICTDICVITTAALLKSSPVLRDVPVKVFEPGCSGINGELHRAALQVMQSFQVEII